MNTKEEIEDEQMCEQCLNKFNNICVHWSRSSDCSHPEFTEHQKEVITGLVMGDGWVEREEGKNPCLRVGMINNTYLQYLSEVVFPTLGGDINDRKSETSSEFYIWRLRSHPDLDEYAQWYSSGEKVFPEDISLTPVVLKHWYCCDGRMMSHRPNPCIEIAMSNEIGNQDKIENMFSREGFKISHWSTSGNRFHARFTVSESDRMWDYMGTPVKGFEKKWPEEKR